MRTLLAIAFLSATLSSGLTAADATVTSSGGKPAVLLTLPDGWTSEPNEAKVSIHTEKKHPHIQVWATTAADLATAEKTVATLVVSEVTGFTTTTATDLTIASAPARQLIGTGLEADDSDPSNAEVTLFTVGTVVYVAISHGEGDGAAKRHAEVNAVLASAKSAP